MILDTLAESTRIRVEKNKKLLAPDVLRREAEALGADTGFPFIRALETPEISFICEIKKASPSKGIIAKEFPYLRIAADYEMAGAAAISVLTEPDYFMGSDHYLQEIAMYAGIPILRKDFTIDAYQIFQARVLGASAVLLIAALLDTARLTEYLFICESLGLSALVETHSEAEVESALAAGARVIGVNNRDLFTFQVDTSVSRRLRPLIPADRLFVSESGISGPEEVAGLSAMGTHGVLIGEALMRCDNKKTEMDRLRGRGVIG